MNRGIKTLFLAIGHSLLLRDPPRRVVVLEIAYEPHVDEWGAFFWSGGKTLEKVTRQDEDFLPGLGRGTLHNEQ